MADMGNIHKEIIIPNRIYLQGIQPDTTEEELENKFRKYGSIIETRIIRDRITGEKKDYAFITFDSQQVAENVKATCKSVDIHGTEIIVGTAKIQRRPKFFNRYNGNMNQPPTPRYVSVPCTVSADGLYSFHQQLLPICFPVEPGVPLEGEEYNGLATIPEGYPTSPERSSPTSKHGTILPAIENGNRFDANELPNCNNKKVPVTVTSSDYVSSTYNPVESNRKHVSMNGYAPPTPLPVIANASAEPVSGGGNQVEPKNALTTTNIHLPNLPNVNGHLPPNSFGTHPMNCSVDVTILNGNMAYHYFPVATILPPEWPQVEPNYVKAEPRKTSFSVPSSMPSRNSSNRVSFASNKINGDLPLNGTNLKSQQYLFMSTGHVTSGHTKMNRVMVQ